MISIFKEKINAHSDSLQSAIAKKSSNKSLSSKSLIKLEKLINIQYAFQSCEAKSIFGSVSIITNANLEGVSRFIKDVKNIKSFENNSFINYRIALWESNAKKLLALNSKPKEKQRLLGNWARGTVYKEGSSIVKETQNLTPNEIFHEANMCNEYNLKKGRSQKSAVIAGNIITMPFIKGEIPNPQETLMGVNQLFEDGFLMGDAKPSNFLKTKKDTVEPIDFGLVFMRNELELIDKKVKKNILTDYIKGGYRSIPDNIKAEYSLCIKKIVDLLGKESPTRKMNTKILSKAGL